MENDFLYLISRFIERNLSGFQLILLRIAPELSVIAPELSGIAPDWRLIAPE